MMGSRSLRLFERMGIDFKGEMVLIESTVTGEILIDPYGRLAYDLDLEEESGKSELLARVNNELPYRMLAMNRIADHIRSDIRDGGEMTVEQFVNSINRIAGYSTKMTTLPI